MGVYAVPALPIGQPERLIGRLRSSNFDIGNTNSYNLFSEYLFMVLSKSEKPKLSQKKLTYCFYK